MMLQADGYTHPGVQRTRNEDAFALPPASVGVNHRETLLLLADGAGGSANGQLASRMAVLFLMAQYYCNEDDCPINYKLRQTIERVNTLIWSRQTDEAQMLTTLVAAVVQDNTLFVANVGDSRAYLVSATGQCRLLTEDHSDFQERKVAGLVDTSAESDNGMITRALGLTKTVDVDLYRYSWREGETLVLCSDGLLALSTKQMSEIVRNHAPNDAARLLVEQANQLDGSDNATAVVATRRPAPQPAQIKRRQSHIIDLLFMLGGMVLGAVTMLLLNVN
ncbi:MAG: PP2C family protein-serine/threonine phosphatase [Candidatus Promineifilaceae bacterium]